MAGTRDSRHAGVNALEMKPIPDAF
jgi:hypothetical protein